MHTPTATDVANRFLDNTVTVVGRDLVAPETVTASARDTVVIQVPIIPPPQTPRITLEKTASPTSSQLPAGDNATAAVIYTYIARNTGDTSLSNV
jgi:hypothetical protein